MAAAAPPQGTAAWLSRRTQMITASDFAAVLGRNPYKSRLAVFREKCGIGESKEPFHLFVDHGTKYEPVAIRKYEARTGRTVRTNYSCEPHSENFSYIGGSPDGIVEAAAAPARLVEVKCPFRREIVAGSVPPYNVDQVQGLMWIFDLDVADFVQFRPEGHDPDVPEVLDITEVPRDIEWAATNVPKLCAFWHEVQAFLAKTTGADPAELLELQRPYLPRPRKRKAAVCLIDPDA